QVAPAPRPIRQRIVRELFGARLEEIVERVRNLFGRDRKLSLNVARERSYLNEDVVAGRSGIRVSPVEMEIRRARAMQAVREIILGIGWIGRAVGAVHSIDVLAEVVGVDLVHEL